MFFIEIVRYEFEPRNWLPIEDEVGILLFTEIISTSCVPVKAVRQAVIL
jgi:hypothetical protein